MKWYYYIVLSLVIAAEALPQQTDSLLFYFDHRKPDVITTSFSHQLNTYQLNTGLNWNSFSDKLYISLNENYNSTLIKTSEKNIKDAQYLSILAGYKITDDLEAGLSVFNNILSDSRKIQINSATVSKGTLFSKFTPYRQFYMAPMFGYSNDRQIGESDYGMVYGGEAALMNFSVSDFMIDSYGLFRNEDISPRKNLFRDFTVAASSNYQNKIINRISAGYSETGRDFYYKADSLTSAAFSIDNNLQRRTEKRWFLADEFIYNDLLRNLNMTFGFTFYDRNIDREQRYKFIESNSLSLFDTKIEELEYEIESGLNYRTRNLFAIFTGRYSERDERHSAVRIDGVSPVFYEQKEDIEKQKNNFTRRIYLSASVNWMITEDDIMEMNASQSKLQYDTPSELNYDDRDELLSIIRLRYTRNIHSFFDVFVSSELNIRTLSYLFAERSSNNNVNRVLNFKSGGIYKGKAVTSFNSFTVSANYTVYDYQDINPNYTSFALRQAAYYDSTSIRLNRNLSAEFKGYYKQTEQGSLNWSAFTLAPNREVEEIYLHPAMVTLFYRMRFSVGLRYFRLETFRVSSEERTTEQLYRSIGPSTEIFYKAGRRVSLSLEGWYEFIRNERNELRELATLNFNLYWII